MIKVALHAGHGPDSSNEVPGLSDFGLNNNVVHRTKKLLEGRGITVVLTQGLYEPSYRLVTRTNIIRQ